MSIKKLNEKSKDFQLSKEDIDKIEQGRLLFISKFPIDEIKDLTVDQYVQGTDENSFCYWLEFKKILFGIGGGNASKFGLYKAKDGNYYTNYGKNKKQLSDTELITYFEKIKNDIIKALKFVKEDKIDQIRTIDSSLWNMVLQKILSLYYPNEFLNIGSPEVLKECALDLDIKDTELIADNSIQINYECKKLLSSMPEYEDWSYGKLGSFIWQTYLPESERVYYIVGSKYGKYADEDIFPAMFENSVIAIGFASHINLEKYFQKKQSEITEYLKEEGEDSKSYSALKYFLNLKVGDRVAIKADGSPKGTKGFLSIVGIAEVIEKNGEIYHYDPDGLGHLINVKFIQAPVYKEFELGGYGRTIHKLSRISDINLIFKSEYEPRPIESFKKDYKELFTKWLKKIYNKSSNSGTISSYIKAIELLSEKIGYNIFQSTDINKLKELYEDLIKEQKKEEGPYHNEEAPSYGKNGFYSASVNSYIEFLRDYKADIEDIEEPIMYPLNTIFYGPPGTGKTYNTVLRAAEIIENRKIETYAEALEIFKSNLRNRIEFITFHQNYSYEDFIQGLRPDIENDKELTFQKKDGVFKIIADKALKNIKESENPQILKKPFKEVFNEFMNPLIEGEVEEIEVKMKKVSYYVTATTNKSIEFRKASGGTSHTLSISTLEKMYEDESILDMQGLASYYSPLLNELLIKGEDSEGRKKEVKRENYVIIIDEINRANISRVFGELITLIEPDKRSLGRIPLEARLPSGDKFIVPSNLYIIGTMNTADKSIALLDIALRRRFEFESMYPQYEIEDDEIYDVDILQKINAQIIKSKGYDFQIGHAYFMGDNKDLVKRMNKKVIPLLLEYYMNDEKEVKEILSNAGLQIKTDTWPIEITGKND